MTQGDDKWSFLHHVDWFNVGVGVTAFIYIVVCIILAASAASCTVVTVNSGSGSLDESKGAIIVKPPLKREDSDDQRRPDFRDR